MLECLPDRREVFDLGSDAHHDSRSAYDFVADRCGQDVADYWVDAFCTAYEYHSASEMSMGAPFALMRSLRSRMEGCDERRAA